MLVYAYITNSLEKLKDIHIQSTFKYGYSKKSGVKQHLRVLQVQINSNIAINKNIEHYFKPFRHSDLLWEHLILIPKIETSPVIF